MLWVDVGGAHERHIHMHTHTQGNTWTYWEPWSQWTDWTFWIARTSRELTYLTVAQFDLYMCVFISAHTHTHTCTHTHTHTHTHTYMHTNTHPYAQHAHTMHNTPYPPNVLHRDQKETRLVLLQVAAMYLVLSCSQGPQGPLGQKGEPGPPGQVVCSPHSPSSNPI